MVVEQIMWTGSSALKNIDQSLQTIRNEVVRLDNQLSQLTESVAANQRYRIKVINDIAKIRLAEIEKGNLLETLSAADQQAVQILQQREAALAALNTEIEKIDHQISTLEIERENRLTEVNKTSQQLVDIEAAVQAQLKVDDNYLAQLKVASDAESVAEEASLKVEQAQADMTAKAEPYRADELFMYLWGRGYGTTEYSAGLFARFMDSRVARIIKYEESRINYWNLTEIPKRLNDHADAVANIADEAHMALQQLEVDALEAAGASKAETELVGKREQLDEFDDQIEDTEQTLNTKLEDRARFVAGQDDYMRRCLSQLTQALEHNDLQAIHRYVRATHSPTDDQLVLELQSVDGKLEDIEGDLLAVRNMHNNKLSRLKELEQVRRNFKNSRFDDVRSGFGNEALLAGVLGQFLQGVVSGSDVWRVLQRNQRYRDIGSVPDFGSGGLGDLLGGGRIGRRTRTRTRQRQGGSTWHWPTPRRGGGGFKFPRGGGRGSSSGGGFSTGGGF